MIGILASSQEELMDGLSVGGLIYLSGIESAQFSDKDWTLTIGSGQAGGLLNIAADAVLVFDIFVSLLSDDDKLHVLQNIYSKYYETISYLILFLFFSYFGKLPISTVYYIIIVFFFFL